MNMLFAGDFAQLPPAIGQEHASLYSRTVGCKSTSRRDQEATVGKALWHQVTTVVILQQNMRQRSQTHDDASLRQALTNMRYKACTAEDIAFLKTRISSPLPGRPLLTSKDFRDVSIITALNVHKDEINRLGSLRFAQETSQELTHFYSEDTLSTGPTEKSNKGSSKTVKNKSIVMTDNLQNVLWNQPPSSTDKGIPGKLSLCVGMPVIIRTNAATELCITRGQEGTVHSWQLSIGSKGQSRLDTLFVKLQNPPQPVQFDGLPVNVVPLTRSTVSVKCSLPNDETLSISRNQIEVLPNFSMTDYSSQGKTRLFNPVDLNNCRSHQSYYTALSRSASAAGTCIVQGFDSRMITGGASGALRQEFRDLEILDDITRLRYDGKLSDKIVGDRRWLLIEAFRAWKGEDYVPASVHRAIRWGKSNPFHHNQQDDTIGWHIVSQPTKTNQVNPESSCGLKRQHHHIIAEPSSDSVVPAKKLKTSPQYVVNSNGATLSMPHGTQWSNNSCAFDCIVTILYYIWTEKRDLLTGELIHMDNRFMTGLINKFIDHTASRCSLEDARDHLRQLLHIHHPAEFQIGEYTSLDALAHYIFRTKVPIWVGRHKCKNQHVLPAEMVQRRNIRNYLLYVQPTFTGSAQLYVNHPVFNLSTQCPTCHSHLDMHFKCHHKPTLLFLEVASSGPIHPDMVLQLNVQEELCQLQLRGIAYFGGGHFVSRLISSEGHVWFHDGITSQ